MHLLPDYSSQPIVIHRAPAPGRRIIDAFLTGRNPNTLRAYQSDLEHFAAFVHQPTPAAAIERLLTVAEDPDRRHGAANELALVYRQSLKGAGLSAATINRRLSALRAMTKLARTLGYITWTLEVDGIAAENYRDTRGPGNDAYRKMLATVAGDSPKSIRDTAILRLLFDLALRRGEVAGLLVGHVDLTQKRLWILGKHRSQREPIDDLPPKVIETLAAWIAVHPDPRPAAPLFLRLDNGRGGDDGALTGKSIWEMVVIIGRDLGINPPKGHNTARPHGLRHAAITHGLDKTNGNLRMAQKFARHRKLDVTARYDDARVNLAGQMAALVSA